MLAQQSKSHGAAARLNYIPTRQNKLILKLLAEAVVWTNGEDDDGRGFFGMFEGKRRNR